VSERGEALLRNFLLSFEGERCKKGRLRGAKPLSKIPSPSPSQGEGD